MTDDDDLKRRNEQLAKELLESLRRGKTSPERQAYDAEKEQADKASLEDYYRRTGQVKEQKGKARSGTEMLFAASLMPCPHCKSLEAPKMDLVGSGTSWSVTGTCPRCNTVRSHAWTTRGIPAGEGGCAARRERPSAIIRVGQFMAELDRLVPLLRERPESLQPIEWRASIAAMERVHLILNELLKFVPANMQIIPDTKLSDAERADRTSRGERYQKKWLEARAHARDDLAREVQRGRTAHWASRSRQRHGREGCARSGIDDVHAAWVRAGRVQGAPRGDWLDGRPCAWRPRSCRGLGSSA